VDRRRLAGDRDPGRHGERPSRERTVGSQLQRAFDERIVDEETPIA